MLLSPCISIIVLPPVSAAVSEDVVLICVEDGVDEDDDDEEVLSKDPDAVVGVVDAFSLCPDFVVVVVVDVELESEALLLPLSGHIPVPHGSLEQHPLKSPLVQTYHCVLPVQLIGPAGGCS